MFGGSYTLEINNELYRIDCYPEEGANKDDCEKRGCIYAVCI